MRHFPYSRIATLLLACGSLAAASSPRYVPTRQIVIEYSAKNAADITGVDLWVSRDSGRTWQTVDNPVVTDKTARYLAPEDGKYDFYLVLRGSGGVSGVAPLPGCAPTTTVIVDTVAPLLQVHHAAVESDAEQQVLVCFDATLVEENLSPVGLRVFYRPLDGDWTDGGPAHAVKGRFHWVPPAIAPPLVDLRVIATDLAGNRTSDDVSAISLPRTIAPTPSPPTSQPTEPAASPRDAATPEPSAASIRDARHLRDQAAALIRDSRYSLAAAHLENAARLTPGDADVLTDLGSTLIRLGRYEDAGARFASALHQTPDHVGALQGAALVAATQKRYPLARAHLRRLQDLLPQSGLVWLRSGDVEQRLGQTGRAREAWQRVLRSDDADQELHERARRRLSYFGPGRSPLDSPLTMDNAWPEPPQPPPSSSSTVKTSTKKPPP